MRYRLMVTDIDDTLLTSDKRLTDEARDALIRVQEAGVKLAIASGRLPYGVRPYVEALRIRAFGGYYLSFNGGLVLDSTDNILHAETLPDGVFPQVYEMLRNENVTTLVHTHDAIFADKKVTPYTYTEPQAVGLPLNPVDDLVHFADWGLHKILLAGEPSLLRIIEQKLTKAFSDTLDVYQSAPFFLDIMPKGVSKGSGVKMLAERMGITTDEVIACGDSFNDLEMIRTVGMGVAMANAEEAVKAAARYVTKRDCDRGGIVEAAEKFVLG